MTEARRGKGNAAAIVTIAIASGIAVWISRARTTTRSIPSTVESPRTGSIHDSPRAPPIVIEGAASLVASRVSESSSNDSAAPPDSSSESGESLFGSDEERDKVFPIDGIVIVTDAKGRETLDADGELIIVGRNSDERREEPVTVTSGRFHFGLPGWRVVSIDRMTLGGRPAFEDRSSNWPDYIYPKSGPHLVLRVLSSQPSLVHFIDATSGAELTNLSLFHEVDDPSDPGDEHGEKKKIEGELRRGVNSPIEFDAQVTEGCVRWEDTVEVRAPGYAPASFEVDHRHGGSWFVPMVRVGSLSVTVVGAPPGAEVEIDRPDGNEELRIAMREQQGADYDGDCICSNQIEPGAPVRFESLPAGKYVANAVVGPELMRVSLARCGFELVATQHLELKLTCRSIEHAAHVPVAGTLEVPEEWGDRNFKLEIVPVRRPDLWRDNCRTLSSEDMTCDVGSPRVYHWKFVNIESATYCFRVFEFDLSVERTVDPKGSEGVRLVAPNCGDVALRIVDAESGAPVDASSVEWCSDAGPGIYGRVYYLQQSERSQLLEGRVPIGRGAVGDLGGPVLIGDGFLVEEEPFEIHAGRNEFTLHARRTPRIQLALSFEGWRVPWTSDVRCDVMPVDHDGELVGEGGGDTHTLHVSRPGRYRIEISTIVGFDPIPAFEVEFAAGKSQVRTIVLERKP